MASIAQFHIVIASERSERSNLVFKSGIASLAFGLLAMTEGLKFAADEFGNSAQ